MNTDIIQILNSSEISLILQQIAEKGIPIQDTWAPWTLGITIVGTFIGTLIGSKITMNLFKKQEKIRIKEQIRLDFYQQYEKLYKGALKSFSNFKKVVDKHKEPPAINDILEFEIRYNIKINVIDINSTIDLIKTTEDIKNNWDKTIPVSIESIVECIDKLKCLQELMESNKIITGYDSDKFNNIKDYLNRLPKGIENLEKCKMDVTRGKYTIEKYKNVLNANIEKFAEIEKYIKELQDINSDIERDFIGQYFEKTIRFKYIKRFFKKIINSILSVD